MRGFILQSGEKVIRVFHQTKWVLLKPFFISTVLLLAPWWYIVRFSLPNFRSFVIVWSIVPIAYFLRSHKLWTLKKYIITSKRLIKMHHEALFKKVVVETPLERILNVSFKTTGILSVLGNFGDVEVQVVGLIEPMVLKNITHPAKIKEYLWRAHEEAAKREDFSATHLQEKIGYTKYNQRVM